jgi:hypothetical protein
MNQEKKDSFSYLAFNDESWELLAHGRTASLALRAAGEIVPHAVIRVISAAPFGRTIWDRGAQLDLAERALRQAREALKHLRSGKHATKSGRTLH